MEERADGAARLPRRGLTRALRRRASRDAGAPSAPPFADRLPRRPGGARIGAGPFDMIASIRLGDFKNFADETLRLGPFTVIVGEEARDAGRVSRTAWVV